MKTPAALKHFPLAHLAIAVPKLAGAAKLYKALGFTLGKPEVIARAHIRAQMAAKDGLCFELLEARPAGSGPIAKFIEKRGPGIHHIALRSAALDADLKKLKRAGIRPLPGYPASGAGYSRVAFMDPKTTGGVLFELVEYSGNR